MPRAVRFTVQPEVHELPPEEARDAWLARVGPWSSAPKHDELWDGNMKQFRAQELTAAELRRLRFDDKLRRAMPNSVFWVYKRYRKKLPPEALEPAAEDISPPSGEPPSRWRRHGDDEDDDDDDDEDGEDYHASIHGQAVPREFIQAVLEDSIKECLSAGIKPVLKKQPSGLRASLRRSLGRRGSRGAAREPAVEGENGLHDLDASGQPGVSLPDDIADLANFRKPSLLDYFLPFRTGDDDLGVALPWLESIQRLDGLSNTSVPRSDAVEDIWDLLEDAFSKLRLLGTSFVWDLEALRQSIWPFGSSTTSSEQDGGEDASR